MGRPYILKYTKYGTLGQYWVGTRYSTPPAHPAIPHPGYTPAAADVQTRMSALPHVHVRGVNMVVGLYSVEQLTLGAQISGFKGITEVYNLIRIDRIINHFSIPGTD